MLLASYKVAAGCVGDPLPQTFKVRVHKPRYWVNLFSGGGNSFFLRTLAVSLLHGDFL